MRTIALFVEDLRETLSLEDLRTFLDAEYLTLSSLDNVEQFAIDLLLWYPVQFEMTTYLELQARCREVFVIVKRKSRSDRFGPGLFSLKVLPQFIVLPYDPEELAFMIQMRIG